MLKKLYLQHFRNYQELNLDFEAKSGLTYLIGDNGQGKTNILEAIYLLALGKSFRVSKEENLIKWGEDFARVKAEFDYKDLNLEVFLGKVPQPKRVFKRNEVKSSILNFLGHIKVVFFNPEDLNILYLGPELRRQYLDILNIQSNKEYLLALKKFKRIKEQRNALLNLIKDNKENKKDLEIWDKQIVENGIILWKERAKTLEYFSKKISQKYQEITNLNQEITISYQNSLNLDFDIINLSENLVEIYKQKLAETLDRDINSGHTQIGPHRDEIIFNLNEKTLYEHASRGEYRTILLALKLIEMDWFNDQGDSPILLLDDVFSELDHQRQKFLLEKVLNFQTFITTTKDSAILSKENLLNGDFIEIFQGKAFRA